MILPIEFCSLYQENVFYQQKWSQQMKLTLGPAIAFNVIDSLFPTPLFRSVGVAIADISYQPLGYRSIPADKSQ